MSSLGERIRRFLDEPVGHLTGPRRGVARVVRIGVFLVTTGVAALILASVLAWGNLAIASQSSACANCHELDAAYAQWAKSTHKSIGCLNCHMEPTLPGYFAMNVRAVANATRYVLRDYKTPLHAEVSDASCLKCHPRDVRPDEIRQAALRIDHSKHDQQQCADCHGRLVHMDAGDTPMPPLARSHEPKDCKVCHATPKPEYVHGSAGIDCSSCHSGDVPRHQLAVFQGVMPREGCQDCHVRLRVVGAPEECQKCHVSPHGIEDRVDVRCDTCHTGQQSWTAHKLKHSVELAGKHAEVPCERCHSRSRVVPAPAPGGTVPECSACHEAKHAAKGDNKCSSCHTPEGWKPAGIDHASIWDGYTGKHTTAECKQCHESNGKAVEKPETACKACHKPPEKHFGDDCVQCHESGGRFKMRSQT